MNKKYEYILHFNHNSDMYFLCRPDYPEAFFDYLAQLVNRDAVVWDCGTGNGQAAKFLAARFKQVIATDINSGQLAVAVQKSNIEYICCPTEKTPIPSQSINLITIAQALHWFNFHAFYDEVRRVSAPNALIAAWCYSLGEFKEPAIDEVIAHLYYDILGNQYWPKERFYVDEAYNTIPFPFIKQEVPSFHFEKVLTFEQLLGYLSTWSAVKEYQMQLQKNPLELIYDRLKQAWGNETEKYTIHWPLHCLLAKVHQMQ